MDRRDKDDEEKRQQEIEDVIREETSRRKPIDTDAIRERQEEKRDLRAIIRNADEAAFRAALSEYGLQPGSDAFEKLVADWRALRRPSAARPRGGPPALPGAR